MVRVDKDFLAKFGDRLKETTPKRKLLAKAAKEIAKTVRQATKVEVHRSPHGLFITVWGTPIGKPRMTRQDKWKKRPRVVRYWDWCNAVKEAVAGRIPPAEKVKSVALVAFFEPPKSWPKKRRYQTIGLPHLVKPDSSNVLKGLEDTLWPSTDEALADVRCVKQWDWTARLEVEIRLA